MPRFPDPPAPNAASLRERLQFMVDVLDPVKDECYDGLACMEPAARAVHQASLAVKHMAEMSEARRGFDIGILYAPVDDAEMTASLLGERTRDNDNIGSGRTFRHGPELVRPRPSQIAAAERQAEQSDEGEHLSDGSVITTRGARALIEEHDLDIVALVKAGKVRPTMHATYEMAADPRGRDLPPIRIGVGDPSVVQKSDIRDFLGRPENKGRDRTGEVAPEGGEAA